jgi:hypothetical protein
MSTIGRQAGRTSDSLLNRVIGSKGMDPLELLVREEVDVVGRVDRLWDPIDLVRDWPGQYQLSILCAVVPRRGNAPG